MKTESHDFQQNQFIHSMNKLVNSVYFSPNIIDKEYGYYLFSKFSKTKEKYIVNSLSDKEFIGEVIKSYKFNGSSKSIEILYDLEEVFNKKKYENKKKYQNRIKSPLTLISKLNLTIEEATLNDFNEIKILHDEWVDKKLSDPRVHKISFSKTRYLNCVRVSLERPQSYRCYVFKHNNRINGCRVIAIENDVAFDLAFFSRFWETSQLTEAQNILSLQYMLSNNIKYLNTGLASGSLKNYKKQYPHYEVYVYRKINKKISQDINDFFN